MAETIWRYLGDGTAWFAGVPARDLTEEEVAALPEALAEAVRRGELYRGELSAVVTEADPPRPPGPVAPDAEARVTVTAAGMTIEPPMAQVAIRVVEEG